MLTRDDVKIGDYLEIKWGNRIDIIKVNRLDEYGDGFEGPIVHSNMRIEENFVDWTLNADEWCIAKEYNTPLGKIIYGDNND